MFERIKVVLVLALTFSAILLIQPVAGSPTPPVASFTYTPTQPIFGQIVIFDASASYDPDGGTILSYFWKFGDGSNVTLDSSLAHHNYTAIGTYNVTLKVTDSELETGTTWHTVTVRGYPVASFTYSPARPIVKQAVTFNASSSKADGGTIASYSWDFGDGAHGSGMIVQHNYTATGSRTVTLNVTDSEGLSDTTQATFTVRGYPVASFTYSPALPLVGQMVTFNASRSTPDGGNILTYHWDFGDLNSGSGMIVYHAYTGYGNHTVTLTVTDSEDLSDTCSRQIRILIAPVASFTYSPKRPAKNVMVTFNASASHDPDRVIRTYHWDFGDKNSGTGMIVGHAYAKEGTYNITLTVTDDDGLTDTTWKLVTVFTYTIIHDIATTNVAATPTEVYPGYKVNITVTARNKGTEVESFNVTIYYGGIGIETKKVTNLLNGTQITLTFIWNTQGVPPGYYTISANATIAVDDNMSNNFCEGVVVKFRLWGDLNGDGMVSLADFGKIKLIYSQVYPYKNPPYDVNNMTTYYYLPSLITGTPEYLMPDINADGLVTFADVGLLKLIYSGYFP
jgi:PKD repeat protein